MALLGKRLAVVGLTVGRKYGTRVNPTLNSPPYVEIPMDRVFEISKTGTRFVLTNDYSVARNGNNDRNEFVVYYPQKFMCSYHPKYEDMKSSGIDYITKFNFAKPGTQQFRDLINIRCEAMAALSLFTDAPNTDNVEFVHAYHDNLLIANIHDDFMLKTIPKKFVKFQERYIENLKLSQRVNEPNLFDKNDSTLSSEEKQLVDEANKIFLAMNDLGKRLRKHCSAHVFENYCIGNDLFYDYCVVDNHIIRSKRSLTWDDYVNIGPYQTAIHAILALNDHREPPLMSLFDPFITIGIFYCRLWNDVFSYYKESKTLEKCRVNCVHVLQNMYPNMSTVQAMAESMRMQNKILHDLEEHVEYLRDEEKRVYINIFKQFIGFTETQFLARRYSCKRISGTPSMYETFEHNGVIYGNDEY